MGLTHTHTPTRGFSGATHTEALSPVSPEASVQGQSLGPHRQKAAWARGGGHTGSAKRGAGGSWRASVSPRLPSALGTQARAAPPRCVALEPRSSHTLWTPLPGGEALQPPTQTPCSGAAIMRHITWAPPVPLSPPCAALGLGLVQTDPWGAPRPLYTGRGFRACSHPRSTGAAPEPRATSR